MQKLLSLLNIVTLTWMTSTSIVACGGGETSNSQLTKKIDISDKITDFINLGQLSENIATEILNKLQKKIVSISSLENITNNDYNVYKAGTTTDIKDSDVTAGNSLKIKIVAKGNNFKGEKDNITMNYNQKNVNQFKIKGFNGEVSAIAFDSHDNTYFVSKYNVFLLKQGETNAKRISNINDNVYSIAVDSKDNVYFGIYNGGYILKQSEIIPTKIKGFNKKTGAYLKIVIDSKDNVYFFSYLSFVYLLKIHTNIVTEIQGIEYLISKIVIDSKDNVYLSWTGFNSKIYLLKYGTNTVTTIFDSHTMIGDMAIDSHDNLYFSNRYFVKKKNKVEYEDNVLILNTKNQNLIEVQGINIEDYIYNLVIDSHDNVYFVGLKVFYVLKHNETMAEKIQGINESLIHNLVIDSHDNVYFLKERDIYVFKLKNTFKINNIVINRINFFILKLNSIYIAGFDGAYVLKNIN